MKATIESTTNGVQIVFEGQGGLLPTTDVAELIEVLQKSLQRCGKWTVELHPFQKRN